MDYDEIFTLENREDDSEQPQNEIESPKKQREENMYDNIYGDVGDYDLGIIIETEKERNKQLEEEVQELRETNVKLHSELLTHKEKETNLANNISSLFLTAKAEIERKNRQITELNSTLDNMVFRRRGYQKNNYWNKEHKEKKESDNYVETANLDQNEHETVEIVDEGEQQYSTETIEESGTLYDELEMRKFDLIKKLSDFDSGLEKSRSRSTSFDRQRGRDDFNDRYYKSRRKDEWERRKPRGYFDDNRRNLSRGRFRYSHRGRYRNRYWEEDDYDRYSRSKSECDYNEERDDFYEWENEDRRQKYDQRDREFCERDDRRRRNFPNHDRNPRCPSDDRKEEFYDGRKQKNVSSDERHNERQRNLSSERGNKDRRQRNLHDERDEEENKDRRQRKFLDEKNGDFNERESKDRKQRNFPDKRNGDFYKKENDRIQRNCPDDNDEDFNERENKDRRQRDYHEERNKDFYERGTKDRRQRKFPDADRDRDFYESKDRRPRNFPVDIQDNRIENEEMEQTDENNWMEGHRGYRNEEYDNYNNRNSRVLDRGKSVDPTRGRSRERKPRRSENVKRRTLSLGPPRKQREDEKNERRYRDDSEKIKDRKLTKDDDNNKERLERTRTHELYSDDTKDKRTLSDWENSHNRNSPLSPKREKITSDFNSKGKMMLIEIDLDSPKRKSFDEREKMKNGKLEKLSERDNQHEMNYDEREWNMAQKENESLQRKLYDDQVQEHRSKINLEDNRRKIGECKRIPLRRKTICGFETEKEFYNVKNMIIEENKACRKIHLNKHNGKKAGLIEERQDKQIVQQDENRVCDMKEKKRQRIISIEEWKRTRNKIEEKMGNIKVENREQNTKEIDTQKPSVPTKEEEKNEEISPREEEKHPCNIVEEKECNIEQITRAVLKEEGKGPYKIIDENDGNLNHNSIEKVKKTKEEWKDASTLIEENREQNSKEIDTHKPSVPTKEEEKNEEIIPREEEKHPCNIVEEKESNIEQITRAVLKEEGKGPYKIIDENDGNLNNNSIEKVKKTKKEWKKTCTLIEENREQNSNEIDINKVAGPTKELNKNIEESREYNIKENNAQEISHGVERKNLCKIIKESNISDAIEEAWKNPSKIIKESDNYSTEKNTKETVVDNEYNLKEEWKMSHEIIKEQDANREINLNERDVGTTVPKLNMKNSCVMIEEKVECEDQCLKEHDIKMTSSNEDQKNLKINEGKHGNKESDLKVKGIKKTNYKKEFDEFYSKILETKENIENKSNTKKRLENQRSQINRVDQVKSVNPCKSENTFMKFQKSAVKPEVINTELDFGSKRPQKPKTKMLKARTLKDTVQKQLDVSIDNSANDTLLDSWDKASVDSWSEISPKSPKQSCLMNKPNGVKNKDKKLKKDKSDLKIVNVEDTKKGTKNNQKILKLFGDSETEAESSKEESEESLLRKMVNNQSTLVQKSLKTQQHKVKKLKLQESSSDSSIDNNYAKDEEEMRKRLDDYLERALGKPEPEKVQETKVVKALDKITENKVDLVQTTVVNNIVNSNRKGRIRRARVVLCNEQPKQNVIEKSPVIEIKKNVGISIDCVLEDIKKDVEVKLKDLRMEVENTDDGRPKISCNQEQIQTINNSNKVNENEDSQKDNPFKVVETVPKGIEMSSTSAIGPPVKPTQNKVVLISDIRITRDTTEIIQHNGIVQLDNAEKTKNCKEEEDMSKEEKSRVTNNKRQSRITNVSVNNVEENVERVMDGEKVFDDSSFEIQESKVILENHQNEGKRNIEETIEEIGEHDLSSPTHSKGKKVANKEKKVKGKSLGNKKEKATKNKKSPKICVEKKTTKPKVIRKSVEVKKRVRKLDKNVKNNPDEALTQLNHNKIKESVKDNLVLNKMEVENNENITPDIKNNKRKGVKRRLTKEHDTLDVSKRKKVSESITPDKINSPVNNKNPSLPITPLSSQPTTKRRITPIPVKDSPVCSFENILTKSKSPFNQEISVESPFQLTHEGDIPLLHLDEQNYTFSANDEYAKNPDLFKLIEGISLSNINYDTHKFKIGSDDSKASIGSFKELTFENFMEKAQSTPLASGSKVNDNCSSIIHANLTTLTEVSESKLTVNVDNVTNVNTVSITSDVNTVSVPGSTNAGSVTSDLNAVAVNNDVNVSVIGNTGSVTGDLDAVSVTSNVNGVPVINGANVVSVSRVTNVVSETSDVIPVSVPGGINAVSITSDVNISHNLGISSTVTNTSNVNTTSGPRIRRRRCRIIRLN